MHCPSRICSLYIRVLKRTLQNVSQREVTTKGKRSYQQQWNSQERLPFSRWCYPQNQRYALFSGIEYRSVLTWSMDGWEQSTYSIRVSSALKSSLAHPCTHAGIESLRKPIPKHKAAKTPRAHANSSLRLCVDMWLRGCLNVFPSVLTCKNLPARHPAAQLKAGCREA